MLSSAENSSLLSISKLSSTLPSSCCSVDETVAALSELRDEVSDSIWWAGLMQDGTTLLLQFLGLFRRGIAAAAADV